MNPMMNIHRFGMHCIFAMYFMFSIDSLAGTSTITVNCTPNPLHANRRWEVGYISYGSWYSVGAGTNSQSFVYNFSGSGAPNGVCRVWNGNSIESEQSGWLMNPRFNVAPPIGPPAAPSGMGASYSNANKVTVKWNASGDTFSYNIYRSISADSATASLIGSTQAATTFDDTTKIYGKLFYWVKAVNPSGSSGFSSIATGCFFNVISSINPTSRSFAKEAGGGSVLVEADPIVGWTASTTAPWITLNSSQTNGTGDGTVSYVVSANTTADSRIGEVYIGDKVHSVNQSGYVAQISPAETNLNYSVQTCQVSVAVQAGVSWTSVSNAPWIRVVSGQSGTGNGTTAFAVSANTNLETRIGTLRIAGQDYTVNQFGVPTIVTPAITNVPQVGGSFSFTVFALASTTWAATTNAPWVHLLTSPYGTGNVIMAGFTDSNPSYLQRTGIVEVSGARCVVVQQGVANPVFSINPSNATAVSTGAFGYVVISATPDAPWSARSLTGWLILGAQTNGAGDGMISYVASVNNSIYSRTGTVAFTAPGSAVNHTVVQAGHVGVLSPTSQQFTANGGSASTELTINSMCSWTSVVQNAWIQITANNNGVGSRQISYTVAQNNAVYSRTGVVQIAGQPLTVSQSGRNAQIDVESQLFGTDGGMGQVNVTTEGSAYWETVNPAGWISIFQGATNSGNGTVIYIVSPYSETLSQRTAVLTIAGLRHVVTQVGYTATIDPDVRNVMAEGGLNIVTVNSPIGANWQAVPSADWIKIASGESSNAPGPVSYIVDPNLNGVDRVGAIYVAGKTHTINQSASLGGDILPYEWEQENWPEDDSGGAANDYDNDGFTNWQEWRAGTNPRDDQSYFCFGQRGSASPVGVVIVWPSITGRTYAIYRSIDLTAIPAFSNIASGLQGQSGFTTHTDETATASGPYIYRVGVE